MFVIAELGTVNVIIGEFIIGTSIVYVFDPALKKYNLLHEDRLEKGEKDTYITSDAMTVTEKGLVGKIISGFP